MRFICLKHGFGNIWTFYANLDFIYNLQTLSPYLTPIKIVKIYVEAGKNI